MLDSCDTPRKAIVIGASSGIGRELAILLAGVGYSVAVTPQRTSLLSELAELTSGIDFTRHMDLCEPERAVLTLQSLFDEMGGVDSPCAMSVSTRPGSISVTLMSPLPPSRIACSRIASR